MLHRRSLCDSVIAHVAHMGESGPSAISWSSGCHCRPNLPIADSDVEGDTVGGLLTETLSPVGIFEHTRDQPDVQYRGEFLLNTLNFQILVPRLVVLPRHISSLAVASASSFSNKLELPGD